MKEWLILVAEYASLAINAMALVIIVFAATEAFLKALKFAFDHERFEEKRMAWLRFTRWLVAALTFQLASDLIDLAASTNWERLGHIAVIALIRTFLNYFLERDVREMSDRRSRAAKS